MALLTAITVPTYRFIVLRAHATEVRATLHTIAHAEQQHFRDRGAYVSCPPEGEIPTDPVPWTARPCWDALHIEVNDAVRYRYGVELVDGSFVVIAEGDLDGDGRSSSYRLDGRTLHLDVEGGLR